MPETTYPVNLIAPDITPYRTGNTGVEYITTFDSGKRGPHVMLTAIVHGNELCGAITLDFLFQQDVRPLRGKLTLGFMNVEAFHRFNPEHPETSRFVDEDFNRVWAGEVLDGPRESVELKRAREVRPIIDQVDFLLDIHSMQHPTVPLMMCGPTEKGRRLARAISYPKYIVSDVGHAAGKRMRDYGAFRDALSPKNALLVECGQHWDQSSANVARETALRFLAYFDLIDPVFVNAHVSSEQPPGAKVVEVTEAITIHNNHFTFAEPFTGMEIIPESGTVIGWDGKRAIRTPYSDCVLIMPSRRLYKGQTAVRLGRFIDSSG